MYEAQFGLNKRPFRALAKGSEVFVGPQTAATMSGLKKALTSPDAVVAVGGPVGVGKTTVVRRALEAIGENPVIIWVGRMQLGHDEVLELLLEEMGVDLPAGTVQRFTRFRRQLKQYADEGSRVFVVVEDVSRMGSDALSELEALTATDAGVSEGANVVLMGAEELDDKLKDPRLARLRQRLRLRQTIVPMSRAELQGYLKHCFRLAGNEFDKIFETGSADVLHRLSDGIPRVANNLVESSLISAVENRLERVNVAQIKLVASEEYDLSVTGISEGPTATAPSLPPAEQPAVDPAPPTLSAAQPRDDAAGRAPAPVEPARPEPPAPVLELESEDTESTPAAVSAPSDPDDDGIPDLIQDTLPDLEILAPKLARPQPAQVTNKPVEKETPRSVTAPKEKLSPAREQQLTAAQVESVEDPVPEWERDPTLAQLRPDLDALEQAMAVARGLKPDPEAESEAPKTAAQQTPESVPEITLDREIQAKVDEAAEQIRLEAERRAAAEAKKQEESGIDNRPTSEILAEVREKQARQAAMQDQSVEAQFEAGVPTLTIPADADDPYASSDTVHELPVLSDATDPSFEPAAHLNAEAVADATPASPDIEEPLLVPELELELEPEPDSELQPEAEPEPDPAELEKARKADAELERIACNLAQAKSIDDCDDKMAETLFGEEFSMMAAQVAAMAPPELFADDETEESEAPEETGDAANDDLEADPFASLSDFDESAAINVELGSGAYNVGNMDTSASQRLATVRSLNASGTVQGGTGESSGHTPSSEAATGAPTEQPLSIEDQINTSMTQTLKTLSMPPEVDAHDEDSTPKSKGGFFSRFRRQGSS